MRTETEKKFMNLPMEVMDLLQENEIVFVKGGNAGLPDVNNDGVGCHCTIKKDDK